MRRRWQSTGCTPSLLCRVQYQLPTKHAVKQIAFPSCRPEFEINIPRRSDTELDAVGTNHDANRFHSLHMASIERPGDPQNRRKPFHASAIGLGSLAVIGMFVFGVGTAVVSRHVGDQLQLMATETR